MHLPRERLQLDQAGNTWDDTMWVNGNFAQFKLSGQETREEHAMGLDVLLDLYHACALNAPVLKTQHSESKLSLVLSNRHTFPALSLCWHGGTEGHQKLKVQGSWSEERETKEKKKHLPGNHTE